MFLRFMAFAAQLILIVLAVPVAEVFHEAIRIVPRSLQKASPLDFGALGLIGAYMLGFHLLLLGGLALLNPMHPFATLRRFFIEGYGAMAATSLGASAVFLFTTVPFAANYFAWLYVIVFLGYVLLFVAFQALSPSLRAERDLRSFLSGVASVWAILAILVIAAPGALAMAYKASQPFSNAVNALRANLSTDIADTYSLVDAFPGQNFDQPMMFAFLPGGAHLLVWSRTGVLYRHDTEGDAPPEIVLDLSEEVGPTQNEMGAYSFALHPEFGQDGSPHSGDIFLYYTSTNAAGQFNRLVRYDISAPDVAEREASRSVLWDLGRRRSGMHNGGGLFFDEDGFLYISLGDFNQLGALQRIDERLLGGIFRLDPDQRGGNISTPIRRQPADGETANYYIPTDNPWHGEEGMLEEYWAHGFRNPWRMAWDAETGTIWLGDVGWDSFEEHNRVSAGDNAQWPFMEGPEPTERARPETVIGREIGPVYWYAQTALARATMGGVVYRGDRFPGLQGQYIFADNMAATISALDPADPMGTARVIAQGGQYGQLGMTSISTDANGEIYFTFLGRSDAPSGEIVRLTTDEDLPDANPEEPLSEEEQRALLVAAIDTTYISVCGRCHGSDGGGAQDLDLGVPRPDFTSADWQVRVTDEDLRRVIALGGEAVGMSAVMPGWEGVLSDQEIDLMVEKIRSFAP